MNCRTIVMAASALAGVWGIGTDRTSYAESASPLFTAEPTVTVFDYGNADPYDRQNLYGFNHAPSIAHLGGERLLASWFSGPFEASVHQVILGSYSEDGGRTWGEVVELADTPRMSDFDPGFIEAQGRTYLFYSFGRWSRWPFVGLRDAEKDLVGIDSFRVMLTSTIDGGQTWETPREIGMPRGWNCRSNGVALDTGRLLLPLHTLSAPHTASVAYSDDQGVTWKQSPVIATPEKIGAAEPSITQLPDGLVVMSLRSRDGELWFSRSADQGETWSKPAKVGLPAASSSSNVNVDAQGRLLLIHNPTPPPHRTELTLRASADQGATWSEPLELARVEPTQAGDEAWARQVAYPSSCVLDDGTVVVVWTRIEMSPTEQSGIIKAMRLRPTSD